MCGERKSFVVSVAASDLFLRYPRGCYTTVRTVNRDSILEFDFHLNRLATSLCSIFHLNASDVPASFLKEVLLPSLQLAIGKLNEVILRKNSPLKNQGNSVVSNSPLQSSFSNLIEIKLSILITSLPDNWNDESFRQLTEPISDVSDHSIIGEKFYKDNTFTIVVHATEMSGWPISELATVEVQLACRSFPTVKDSDWVRKRKMLEKIHSFEVNEILLQDEHGNILEGSSSNFFVVTKSCELSASSNQFSNLELLRTAPDTLILPGTIRKIVLDICELEHVPVSFQPPNVNEIHLWKGAFITSTSRLLLPIKLIIIPEEANLEGKYTEFTMEVPDLLLRLRKMVSLEVLKRATKIL